MLKSLHISNIVLVENAEIPFIEGFNVLTGETGSGKSAIMGALNYIAGARADNSIMRHEADKGSIEAAFDIDAHLNVQKLLAEAGIDHENGEALIIRRELSRSGKSRAFINNQLAHVSLLREIGNNLIEIVGQHANQRLMNLEQHREILDLSGENSGLKKQFRDCWEEECNLKNQLHEMKNNEAQRLRDIETCRMELDELDDAQLKEHEEEELFADYSRLTNSEELAKYAYEIQKTLTGDKNPIIPNLIQLQNTFGQLLNHDPSLKECFESFQSVTLELEEIAHVVRNYHAGIEYNPHRIEEINARLTLINKIKKKYGPDITDVYNYHEKSKEKLTRLENADIQIETLQERLSDAEKLSSKLAAELTGRRIKAAKRLETSMKKQLQALNMHKACFYVSLSPKTRSPQGDESVEFMFTPNVGEKKISIRECASGGELSRIMLALQTILAGKENTPTIIFDEIDANIGGETAVVVGEKLRELGTGHQVVCITHFPQVATCAQHHLQISKQEKKGRTYTEISLLDDVNRKKELARMSGTTKAKG